MCRYAMYGPYKSHYACFDCRKGFKWPLDAHQMPAPDAAPEDVKCPQCGEPMSSMGLDFKPPRQRNKRQWTKVRILFERGYDYRSCGCDGPGYRPRTLAEASAFLAKPLPRSEGEALLQRIVARAG